MSELGERYSNSFSLKIEFSENDSEANARSLRKDAKEMLPTKIETIAKVKVGNLGLHEAAFKLGTREIVGLLESPLGKQVDMSGFVPYMPKDSKVYTSLDTSNKVVVSLPFEVETDQEIFYAGVFEFTRGANQLSLVLYEDESHEEVAFSS